ncbi:MAG: phosphoribosyltransferase [Flavobacterium sp.]|jgi:hypoxanthine phosphoribosyltransferase
MEILIPEYKIERHVRAMAHRISEEHKNSGNSLPPVLICVLNGSFLFFSDLVKDMGTDCEIDFIRPKSYHGQDNSGGVTFTKDIEVDLKGKRVYIIEDIVDTGATMIEILQRVYSRVPVDVKIVTLVHRKGNPFDVDHFCFEIGDEWVVGYGFDDNGLKRNYRNIYSIPKQSN